MVAFPFATEGAGFIYNKQVTDEAGIDVSSIKTIDQMEAAFQKLNATGKEALIVTNEQWSLADHFLATCYAADIKETGIEPTAYFEKLSSSPEMLRHNKHLDGLLDMMDVMKQYNIYAENPLAPSYEKCAEVLGSGKVGFWYNGNWASKNILAQSNGNSEFGFLPVPMSNDASDVGNSDIAAGITKYFIINKDASDKQIEAAKKILNYFVYDEQGNQYLTEKCGVIPAFSKIKVPDTDPLVNEIIKYRDAGQTIELVNSYLPADNANVVGQSLRKYLNNQITRKALKQEIINYWKRNS